MIMENQEEINQIECFPEYIKPVDNKEKTPTCEHKNRNYKVLWGAFTVTVEPITCADCGAYLGTDVDYGF